MASHYLSKELEAVLLKELEAACPTLEEARKYALKAVCEMSRAKAALRSILPLADLAAGPGAAPLIREAEDVLGISDDDGQLLEEAPHSVSDPYSGCPEGASGQHLWDERKTDDNALRLGDRCKCGRMGFGQRDDDPHAYYAQLEALQRYGALTLEQARIIAFLKPMMLEVIECRERASLKG